jgi:hypothetical protein
MIFARFAAAVCLILADCGGCFVYLRDMAIISIMRLEAAMQAAVAALIIPI